MPNFAKNLDWLSVRFYLFFDISPVLNPTVTLYNFDKMGNPITSTGRSYTSLTLEKTIQKAYDRELQKLAKS